MGAFNAAASLPVQLEEVNKSLPVLFDKDDSFFSTVEKATSATPVSDVAMRIPLHIRPGGYFGQFNSDGGSLGRGSGPVLDKATIQTVPLKIGYEFTAKADWATDSGRKATISVVKKIVADAMPEFRKQVDNLCMTAGDGVLATISSVPSTAGSKDTYQLSLTDGFGARLLRFGQKVNVYDSAMTTHRTSGGEVEIDSIDYETNQIRVSANVAGSTGTDKIVISGVSGASPTSLFGVPYHHNNASTGTWLAMNRANYPEVRANRVNANGQYFSLPFARLAVNKIGNRLGADSGIKPEAWMHPAQVQVYEEMGQLVSVIQKQNSDQGLNLYFGSGMQLAGCSVRQHFSWNKTRMDFIVKSVWKRVEMHPMGFYRLNGNHLFPIYGADGGIATSNVFYLCVQMNLATDNPPALSYVDGLAIPSGY